MHKVIRIACLAFTFSVASCVASGGEEEEEIALTQQDIENASPFYLLRVGVDHKKEVGANDTQNDVKAPHYLVSSELKLDMLSKTLSSLTKTASTLFLFCETDITEETHVNNKNISITYSTTYKKVPKPNELNQLNYYLDDYDIQKMKNIVNDKINKEKERKEGRTILMSIDDIDENIKLQESIKYEVVEIKKNDMLLWKNFGSCSFDVNPTHRVEYFPYKTIKNKKDVNKNIPIQGYLIKKSDDQAQLITPNKMQQIIKGTDDDAKTENNDEIDTSNDVDINDSKKDDIENDKTGNDKKDGKENSKTGNGKKNDNDDSSSKFWLPYLLIPVIIVVGMAFLRQKGQNKVAKPRKKRGLSKRV